MRQYAWSLISGLPLLFAAFSSSPSYQLQSYGINGAASNSASSSTYELEAETGEVQSTSTSSASYSGLSGSLQAQQANVPPAPNLSNGGDTYYDKLGLIVNSGSNASDTTYAVAISSNGFTTTSYVQADGSLSATPLFQTYTAWGGASGTTIIDLSPSTTYEVKVSAMQGKFTNSAYGPYATSATVSPSISFSISPSSVALPTLLSGSVETGATMTSNFTTNANYGGNIYVSDANAGLKSASHNVTIASTSGNLASQSDGYGLQGISTSQSSGGPLVIGSSFSGTGDTVGALATAPQILFSSTAPVTGGSAAAALLAKANSTNPSAEDYGDILTFIAAASF